MISARRNFSTDRHRTPSSRAFPPSRVSRSLVKKRSRAAPSRVPVLARLGTLITRESSSPLSPSFPRRSLLAFAVSPRVTRRGAADLDAPRLACARARVSALVSLPFIRSFAFALVVRHRSIDRASRSSPRRSIVLDASAPPRSLVRSFVRSFAINQSINRVAAFAIDRIESNRTSPLVSRLPSRRVSSRRLLPRTSPLVVIPLHALLPRVRQRVDDSLIRAPPHPSIPIRRVSSRVVSSRHVIPIHGWMGGGGGES